MPVRAARAVMLSLLVLLAGCGGALPSAEVSTQPAATSAPTSIPPTIPPTAPVPSATVLTTAPAPTTSPVPSATVPTPPTSEPTAVPPSATPRPKPTAKPTVRPATPVPPAPTAAPAEAAQATSAHYVFPVASSGTISYGQYHHDYPASDIFYPVGSAFVAPTGGTVDWISSEDTWKPATDDPVVRGGLSVAIVGDDGVRYYGSHLSAIADGLAVGQHVAAGQVLGRTGNSGDARFTQPHLHFGISRPSTPDDWRARRGQISPYRFLRAWQRGEMITPAL